MSDAETGLDWRSQAAADYRARRQRFLDDHQEIAKKISELMHEQSQIEHDVAELDRAARVFGIQAPEEIEFERQMELTSNTPSGRLFKDVALELLRNEYPKTLKAAKIQALVSNELRRDFHPKTAGMTLYRLAQEGLVERIGRAEWRFVPQKKEGSGGQPEPSETSAGAA